MLQRLGKGRRNGKGKGVGRTEPIQSTNNTHLLRRWGVGGRRLQVKWGCCKGWGQAGRGAILPKCRTRPVYIIK